MKKKTLLAFGICLVFASCLQQKEDAPPPPPPPPAPRSFDWPRIADSIQSATNGFFYNAAGRFYTLQASSAAFNSNYWPNAHALDALTDAYLRKGKDPVTKRQMDDLLEGLKVANGNTYTNFYYDDMQWLLIAAWRAFRETGDTRYRDVCDALWPDVQTGWDNLSNGGFYWRKDRVNKNTPANAPAGIFISRRYQQTRTADDLAWTNNIYTWLRAHMIRPNADVWDGLSFSGTTINYDTRLFTYNYGTVIGCALELYKITNQQQYIDEAVRIGQQGIAAMARDGVLVSGDLGDGGLFNGIFMRYLTRLVVEGNLPTATRNNFIEFIRKNAETMWTKGTLLPASLVGPDWRTVPANTSLTAQLSGWMLAENMAELKRLNLIP